MLLPGESHGGAWLATVPWAQRVRHNWSDLACMQCMYVNPNLLIHPTSSLIILYIKLSLCELMWCFSLQIRPLLIYTLKFDYQFSRSQNYLIVASYFHQKWMIPVTIQIPVPKRMRIINNTNLQFQINIYSGKFWHKSHIVHFYGYICNLYMYADDFLIIKAYKTSLIILNPRSLWFKARLII